MRHGFFIAALIAFAAPAHAEPRSVYVTMVLQAFAAKVECPGYGGRLPGPGAEGS